MTIRVVHLASGREWRGGQRQVWLLARALAKRGGVEQVVVTGRDSELACRLADDGVPTSCPFWTSAYDPRALRAAWIASNAHAIVHAHDSHALALGWIAARTTGARLVATRRVDFPLKRAAFWGRADRVIAISGAVQAALLDAGIPARRIALVPSGVAAADLRALPPLDPRPRLGLAPGTPLAITAGALEGHKDHATLVRAAAAAMPSRPDLHWVIAGEGSQRHRIEELIAALGVGDRVHLLGTVQDAVRLVAASAVFVMSSSKEGLGTAVLDALAVGVPVVGTAAGGIPEMLGGGAGLVVPPGDPPALAAAVVRLLGDAGLRAAVAMRGQEVVERFSDDRMAEGVLQVYRSLNPIL